MDIRHKLVSGRWILTVIAGLVFAYASIAGKIEAQAVAAIITAVFTSYFHRERKEEEK